MDNYDTLLRNFADGVKKGEIVTKTKSTIWDGIKALYSPSPITGIQFAKDVRDIVFSIPDILFWNKMVQFLSETMPDEESRIKFTAKFNFDDPHCAQNLSTLFDTINKLDGAYKTTCFSNITRAFGLELIDRRTYYKFIQILVQCNVYELDFIKTCQDNEKKEYDLNVSALMDIGIFEQHDDSRSGTQYQLSDLGKYFKLFALTDDETPKHKINYSDIKPHSTRGIAVEGEVLALFDSKTK